MPSYSPLSELRRARPLLGTVVSIRIEHASNRLALRSVEAAFGAMQQVHDALSFQSAESELSAVNCLAYLEPVRVGPLSWRLLRAAWALAAASDGAFDPTVAGAVRARDECALALPAPDPDASFRDVRLLHGRRVRYARPLWIDLSGIAKGAAVDGAVRALRATGALGGVVNAGGDLRVFGSWKEPIHVRHPDRSHAPQLLGALTNGAVATSACGGGDGPGHVLDPLQRRPLPEGHAITVVARRAIWADALTKVVHARGVESIALLRRLHADAVIWNSRDPLPRRLEEGSA